MTQYETNMRGTLGKNNRREKDTHPEYAGKCEIDGQMYWISAWVKQGQGGEKFFSLSFKAQDQQRQSAGGAQRGSTQRRDDPDSDVPFNDPLKGRAWLAM